MGQSGSNQILDWKFFLSWFWLMFRYDSYEMPACETDAQKQNLQRKCLKTSFKTPETLGKVKKHSMGHIRGFHMKEFEEKWSYTLCPSNQIYAHFSLNQKLTEPEWQFRAPCPQKKSQDITRKPHAWLLPERELTWLFWGSYYTTAEGGIRNVSASQVWAMRQTASLKVL